MLPPRGWIDGGNQLYVTAPEGLVQGTAYDLRVINRDGGVDAMLAAFQGCLPSVSRVNGVTAERQ